MPLYIIYYIFYTKCNVFYIASPIADPMPLRDPSGTRAHSDHHRRNPPCGAASLSPRLTPSTVPSSRQYRPTPSASSFGLEGVPSQVRVLAWQNRDGWPRCLLTHGIMPEDPRILQEEERLAQEAAESAKRAKEVCGAGSCWRRRNRGRGG